MTNFTLKHSASSNIGVPIQTLEDGVYVGNLMANPIQAWPTHLVFVSTKKAIIYNLVTPVAAKLRDATPPDVIYQHKKINLIDITGEESA